MATARYMSRHVSQHVPGQAEPILNFSQEGLQPENRLIPESTARLRLEGLLPTAQTDVTPPGLIGECCWFQNQNQRKPKPSPQDTKLLPGLQQRPELAKFPFGCRSAFSKWPFLFLGSTRFPQAPTRTPQRREQLQSIFVVQGYRWKAFYSATLMTSHFESFKTSIEIIKISIC